jgi:hypothetical protein
LLSTKSWRSVLDLLPAAIMIRIGNGVLRLGQRSPSSVGISWPNPIPGGSLVRRHHDRLECPKPHCCSGHRWSTVAELLESNACVSNPNRTFRPELSVLPRISSPEQIFKSQIDHN